MPFHVTYDNCPLCKRKGHHSPFTKKLFFGRVREMKEAQILECPSLLRCSCCGIPMKEAKFTHYFKLLRPSLLFPASMGFGIWASKSVFHREVRFRDYVLVFTPIMLISILLKVYGPRVPIQAKEEEMKAVFEAENELARKEYKLQNILFLCVGLPLSFLLLYLFG